MGNKNNRPEVLHECARLAASKFTDEELELLKKTWSDLADRSTGKGIDKDTFLQYVPLSGLLGERLFVQFDVKRNESLDLDEFIIGLATICRGTRDDKIRFLFEMYDVRHDDTVSKDEFATLLNQIPRHLLDHGNGSGRGGSSRTGGGALSRANSMQTGHGHAHSTGGSSSLHHGHGTMSSVSGTPQNGSVMGDESDDESKSATISDTESDHGAAHATGHTSARDRVVTSPNYEDEVDMYTNHDIIERAFAECDLTGEGRLHYEEFKMWVYRNPAIIDYFDDILPYSGTKGEGKGATVVSRDGHTHSRTKKEALPHRRPTRTSTGHQSSMMEASSSVSSPRFGNRSGSQRFNLSITSPDVDSESQRSLSRHGSMQSMNNGGYRQASPAVAPLSTRSTSGSVAWSAVDDKSASMTFSASEIACAKNKMHASGCAHTSSSSSSDSSATSALLTTEQHSDTDAASGASSVLDHSEHGVISIPRNPNDKATSNMTAVAAEGYQSLNGRTEETEEVKKQIDSEVLTYMLLERAMNTTTNEELQRVIREVIDHIPGITHALDGNVLEGMEGVGSGGTSNSNLTYHMQLHGKYSPYGYNNGNGSPYRDDVDDENGRDKDASEATVQVSQEGYLWKKGKFLHLWSKRWYILSGNCMYYYDSNNKDDMALKGVVFLTGCLVEDLVDDVDNEVKGYFGFQLTHQDLSTGEHHRHERRTFYCKSEEERLSWVTKLQHAAQVVPIEDDYVIGKELGKGRFSIVKECVHIETDKHCAVKVIDKRTIETEDKGLLRTEIAVLKIVDHPNIIRLEGIYESKHFIYIVMEKLDGGELFERIVGRPRFSEVEAARLIRPLLEAVAYLHDLGIAHRDLKPENILCGEKLDDIKIADFGLSKMVLPKEKMEGACGTLSYVAPEVLSMQGYGVQADVWSVGVILFLIICGKLPFDGDDHNEIIRKTIQADPLVNPTVWNKLGEDTKGMLNLMLNKNPGKRITARECLKHPFIVNNCAMPLPPAPAPPAASSNANSGATGV